MLRLGQIINITKKMIFFFFQKMVVQVTTGPVINKILNNLDKVNFMTVKFSKMVKTH